MKAKPSNDKDAVHVIYRDDFEAFCRGALEEIFPGRPYLHALYIKVLLHALMGVITGDTLRLIVNLPPRHFKSTFVSVFLVAYLLGRDPTRKIAVVSYSGDLAIELHNQTRALMMSDFYKKTFPSARIRQGKNTETELKTIKNGGRRAVSTGSAITGFGADLIICDDLMKPDDAESEVRRQKVIDYIKHTLISRLENKKGGQIVVIQQRLHKEDPTGVLLESGGWQHLRLAAIAVTNEELPMYGGGVFIRRPGEVLNPDREDTETLKQIEHEVGSRTFQAQWQQEPTLPGGNVIKLEWFGRYDELPPKHHIEYLVQSWDPAVTASETSDYSVCTTWAKQGDIYYLVDVIRVKLDYVDLERCVEEACEKLLPRLVIFEASHIGHALYSKFSGSKYSYRNGIGETRFRKMNAEKDKLSRAIIQTPKIEQGRVLLPVAAPWLRVFEDEIRDFPAARNDDQVDSMVQFLQAMDARIPGVTV